MHVNIIAFIFAMFHSVMFHDSPVDTSVVSEIDNWFMNSAMVLYAHVVYHCHVNDKISFVTSI